MIKSIASDADYARKSQALLINISAAKNIAKILKTNLGPRGTLKMLVGGSGSIRLTKDGCVLLSDMHISHPTAALIARAATAQDDITGDGTTSIVLLIGEILSIGERYLNEGAHPTTLVDGILMAKKEARVFLANFTRKLNHKETGRIKKIDREVLFNVAKTALRTKLPQALGEQLADIVVDAVECISIPGKQIDLFMVEQMHMQHKLGENTQLIKGIVLDHGPRNVEMSRDLKDCWILTCNVSLEYEKSEMNSKFQFHNAQKRIELARAERKVVDDRVMKIVELKNKVCTEKNGMTFVVLNQKGIDPLSLSLLARNGITALRRAKRRNMERLTLACGGIAVNSVDEMKPEVLGWANHVWATELGEEKFTFVEVGDKNKEGQCRSCTILYKGPNKHTIAQIKDATRDGLRAVKNAIEAEAVIPGGGAFEVACSEHLMEYAKKTVKGRPQLGVKCFAEALLVIPKALSQNSGLDTQESIINLQNKVSEGKIAGLDIYTGKAMDPITEGVLDNVIVKEQMLETATYTSTQLLFVDEILKAGRVRKK